MCVAWFIGIVIALIVYCLWISMMIAIDGLAMLVTLFMLLLTIAL